VRQLNLRLHYPRLRIETGKEWKEHCHIEKLPSIRTQILSLIYIFSYQESAIQVAALRED